MLRAALRQQLLALMALTSIVACGREAVVDLDPNRSGPQMSTEPDASMSIDASPEDTGPDTGSGQSTNADAEPRSDIGPNPADAGTGQGPADAETNFDSGPSPFDSGSSVPDLGTNVPDSGPVTMDASTPPADSGTATFDSGTSMGDSGIMPECVSDQDCGRREYCEPTQQVCVDCLQDSQCFFGQVCDTMNGFTCRSRCFGNFCQGGEVCDPARNLCVDCLTDTDCGAGEVCDIATYSCVQCNNNADCSPFSGLPMCLPSEHECVECLADSDCVAPEVCNGDNECRAVTNRPLCEPCTDDTQCGGSSDLCLGNTVSSCAQDCTNSPCPRGYECIDVRNNTARQCVPDYEMFSPSCQALRNLGNNCSYSVRDLDPGCGIRNVQDARCVRDTSNPLGGICVVWCQTDDHCPTGFSCVPQATLTSGYCL